MNIREQVLAEYSNENAAAVAAFAVSGKARFKQLMDCYFSEDDKLSQRAAWSVGKAVMLNKKVFTPYLGRLHEHLLAPGKHPAISRNAGKVLSEVDIPEDLHGPIMNTCFQLIERPQAPIALKAYAITILQKLAGFYPEILPELKLIITENWDNETPAFRSRGKRVLSK